MSWSWESSESALIISAPASSSTGACTVTPGVAFSSPQARGLGAGAGGDQGAGGQQRGGGEAGPDHGVRTTSRGAGATDDRGAGPADVLERAVEGVEQPRDVGGRGVPVQRELRARRLELALGVGAGEADGAGHLAEGERGDAVEDEQLALARGELGERVEGAAHLGVERLVAVPDAGGVPPAGATEGERADVAVAVLELPDLAPAVPGDHEGVADGGPGGRRVTGEGVRLVQETGAGLDVVGVEGLGAPHDRSTVREGSLRRTSLPRVVAVGTGGVGARSAPGGG